MPQPPGSRILAFLPRRHHRNEKMLESFAPLTPQSRTSVTTVPSLPMAAASRALEASTAARWVSSTPHGGLVLGLWSRLKRPSARDVKEVRQERVVGEDGWVEHDADRLGVAVTVAHAIVRGRWGVPPRVSHPGRQDTSKLAKDELRTPESSASKVRDGGLFGLRRGGRRGASRGDDADAMRGRAAARGDRRGGDRCGQR